MKLKTTLLTAATFLWQSIAFSQTDPIVKYLPGNASMVMSLNLLQLGHKISGESFRQSFFYREMMKKPNPELTAFLADPASFGLDLSNNIFIAVVSDTSQENPGTAVHIFGLLKDEALFTHSIEKLVSSNDSIRVYGTNKILFTGNGGPSLAWNNEIFVLSIVNGKSRMMTEVYQGINDSNTTGLDNKMKEALATGQRIQRNLCFELLTPHPLNAFSSNNYFINLVNTPGDIKTWTSGTFNPSLSKKIPMARFVSKLQALTAKNKTAVINFENGKIIINSHSYLEGPLAAVYKKYPVASFNTDLAKRLPKGKLLLMVNLSYNPEMSKEMMQQTGMQGMMDSVKKILPFDFTGMNTAFKNSILLAIMKADEISPDDSVTQKMDGLQVLLAMPIADKTKFLALKAAASTAFDSWKNTESGGRMLKGFHPVVQFNDNLFVMSSSAYAAHAFLNNGGTNPVPEWLQTNTAHPLMMRIDMKGLFSLAMGKQSPGKMGMNEQKMMNMFDEIVVYGGEYENDALNTTLEFRFTNHTDNALKQLFDMINMAAEGKAGK